jgi:hypothetical protein
MTFIKCSQKNSIEAARTRRAGRCRAAATTGNPRESMPLARLAGLVASMPSWISLIIDQTS